MLGIMEKPDNMMTLDFKNEGDLIYMIGDSKNDIASSEYLYSYRKIKASPSPAFDLEEEKSLQEAVAQLITSKVIESAHDLSDGGLFITLAESAMHRQLGFSIKTDSTFRKDAFLFGEAQSRVLVSVSPARQADFEVVMSNLSTKANFLGKVTKENFVIDSDTIMTCATAIDMFEKTLPALMA